MKFTFDDDEIMVQDAARRFLADLSGIDQKLAREAMAEGFSRDEWRDLANLGWLALTGHDSDEVHTLGILAQEIGRAAFASPYIATVCALRLLVAADGSREPLIAEVGAGDRILTFVDPAHDHSRAIGIRTGGGVRLQSARMIVDWLPSADVIVIPFELGGVPALATISRQACGVTSTPCVTSDNARAGYLTLADAEPEWWVALAATDLEEALKCGRLLRAAEAIGGAEGALELTANYVNERRQFGAPIASFQAVRHGLADTRSLIDGAWLAVWDGLGRTAKGEPIEGRAALATWLTKRAFQDAAIKGAQYHGGMGHVVDSHMQFHYRRAGSFHGRSTRDWDLLGEVAAYYVDPYFPIEAAA